MKKNYLKLLLLIVLLLTGGNALGQEWGTVWYTDFSSAPVGMTYSVSNGSVDISTGVLFYHQGGGSGNRAINTAFTDSKFNVDSNWMMEFDWGASSANTNSSNVTFATDKGTAFTITWEKYATAVTITDASSNELTTTLPIDGYNKSTMTNLSHFTITGDKENGLYLTVTNGNTTYVNNVNVTSTFGYPKTFNGSLGRAVSHMALDNIYFKTPVESGFVSAPTGQVIGVNGISRIFTLECLTENAIILYSEVAPSDNETYVSWTTFSNSLTTDASLIYAVATDGINYSEVATIETGAGTAVSLIEPAVFVSDMLKNGNCFNAVINSTNDQSSVLLSPTATVEATFNGDVVSLPFTVTESGTLVVTASVDGYISAQTELSVSGAYSQTWISSDYSTLTAENVTTVLGETWAQIEATGRWASWTNTKEPYTYYQEGEGNGSNTSVENNIRFRNVVLLNLGYGLSRNVSGAENIRFMNTSEGMIAGLKIYSGYGQDVSEANTWMTYLINTGSGMPDYGVNNARILVQASYYSPVEMETITVTSAGARTYCSENVLDFSNVKGLTAYYLTVDGNQISMNQTNMVNANLGIYIEAAEGSYEVPICNDIALEPLPEDVNDLVGVTEETQVEAPIYVLMDADNGLGFYKTSKTFTVGAHTAYIPGDKVSAGVKSLTFGTDEPTGISGVNSDSLTKK